MNRASDNLDTSKLSASEEPVGYPPSSYPLAREGASQLATPLQHHPLKRVISTTGGQGPHSPTLKLLKEPPRTDSHGSADSFGLEPQTNSELNNEYSDSEGEEEETTTSVTSASLSTSLLGSSVSLRPAAVSTTPALRGITITSVAESGTGQYSGSDFDSEEEEQEYQRIGQQSNSSKQILNAFKNSSIVIGGASGEW